jgi:uncharacterized protein (DUF302 family)
MSNGLVTISSRYSVDETVSRLERLLAARGLKLFAVIDHSGEAKQAGIEMPNTKLIVFGSPKGGTPLMLAVPSIAIDLPMKILIREDAESNVWVSYNDPEFLRERHGLPAPLIKALEGIAAIAAGIAQ